MRIPRSVNGLTLLKNKLTPLAKRILISLGLKVAASA